MSLKNIPDYAIECVAKHINERSNKPYSIPIEGIPSNVETPQIFEIADFDSIDYCESSFYAIDGSYNSQEFYNGVCIALYSAGYIGYYKGKQIRLNTLDDPVILGQAYFPEHILITNDNDLYEIYDELLALKPVKEMLNFFNTNSDEIFAYTKDAVCNTTSSLLGFCQEVLEWSLVYEISNLNTTHSGDYILRDGTLRSLNIKQKFLVQLAFHLKLKGIHLLSFTKKSPVKIELSYTFKQIDDYLQDSLKPRYPFKATDPDRKKLCCWFQVPEAVLKGAYRKEAGNMFIKRSLTGGRGIGVFYAARLDYVEKLQNYDWLIADINILDCMPDIEKGMIDVDYQLVDKIFHDMTRLTQEHYILGYPYPLADLNALFIVFR